jgi:hypothetical protein
VSLSFWSAAVFSRPYKGEELVMPNFNAKDYVYPQKLTKKYWDKHKGVLAKMKGYTGVGDAADAAEKAHAKIDWDVMDLGGSQQLKWNSFSMDAWNKVRDRAMDEISKKVVPLSDALLDLAKAAKAAEAEFKKSKLIPASSTKVAGEVAKDADAFREQVKKLPPLINQDWQAYVVRLQEVANGLIAKLKEPVTRAPEVAKKLKDLAGALEKLLKNPSDPKFAENRKTIVGAVNSTLVQGARDITQGTANVLKVAEMGLTPPQCDTGKLANANKILVTWGNTKGAIFEDDAQPTQIRNTVSAFEKAAQRVKELLKL